MSGVHPPAGPARTLALPRLVVAAPATGSGKTTVATGLMAAWRAAGRAVSGHKVGPDYIDPGYHALACGRPGRNLDPHLVGEEQVVPLLLHGALTPAPADIAVVEGVMGLHDGRLGTDGFASTAHVARLIQAPVVLVVDLGRHSRTAAAVAAGMALLDPEVRLAGVVLNRARPGRNTEEVRRALDRLGLACFGALPPCEDLATPSRHLGLVTAAERGEADELVEGLGAHVAAHLDLAALAAVAAQAPDLPDVGWSPGAAIADTGVSLPVPTSDRERPVVAVAGGRAFTFAYPETVELLEAAGCRVVPFDPLHDTALPADTAGLYLGGGFPELHTEQLAANAALRTQVRDAVAAGLPTVAECAGLLYLATRLDDVEMAGAVPATAAMSPRLTLRYPEAVAVADTLLTRAGETVTGHEFHRTATEPAAGGVPAWSIDGAATGFASAHLHASYLHVHWAGHPQLAARFAAAARAHLHARAHAQAHEPVGDPLRHHGDREATPGLLDLAVNVHPAPPPPWLGAALHEAVDASGAYPDVTPATAAVAAHHRRPVDQVLVTAGAAEAFGLLAGARPWRRPVVVHPQFTEPHAALEAHGHRVTTVLCRAADGFALDPAAVPADADLVVVGNPTNPTGVLHPRTVLERLRRPGRVLVVDEAFLDAVDPASATACSWAEAGDAEDVLVLRSLTKHWGIPGVRAGYVLGGAGLVADLARRQPPWSVSTTAIAAVRACLAPSAAPEAARRTAELLAWREHLADALTQRGVEVVPSQASFVLARLGAGARDRLRTAGIAVRRADTFPGLDDTWCRIAARPPAVVQQLLDQLDPHLQETR